MYKKCAHQERIFLQQIKHAGSKGQRDMTYSKDLQKKQKGFIVKRAAMAAAVLLVVLAVFWGIYVNTYYHGRRAAGKDCQAGNGGDQIALSRPQRHLKGYK